MDLRYSEEQQMLADTVGRFIDREYGFEARRQLAATDAGFSEDNWRLLADLGLLGLNVPEQFGGLGAGPADTLIVMQALGRGLVVEPYLSTAVVGAALLSEGLALLPSAPCCSGWRGRRVEDVVDVRLDGRQSFVDKNILNGRARISLRELVQRPVPGDFRGRLQGVVNRVDWPVLAGDEA